jgi:hypothetical protein
LLTTNCRSDLADKKLFEQIKLKYEISNKSLHLLDIKSIYKLVVESVSSYEYEHPFAYYRATLCVNFLNILIDDTFEINKLYGEKMELLDSKYAILNDNFGYGTTYYCNASNGKNMQKCQKKNYWKK